MDQMILIDAGRAFATGIPLDRSGVSQCALYIVFTEREVVEYQVPLRRSRPRQGRPGYAGTFLNQKGKQSCYRLSILHQACLIECEDECIAIKDDNGNGYKSVYK